MNDLAVEFKEEINNNNNNNNSQIEDNESMQTLLSKGINKDIAFKFSELVTSSIKIN